MKVKLTITYTNLQERVFYFNTLYEAQKFAHNEGDHVLAYSIKDW